MGLENKKVHITLTKDYTVEGKTAAVFSAILSLNGISTPVTIKMRDKDLYEEHKVNIREAQQDFQEWVWKVEDTIPEEVFEDEE